MTLDRNTQHIHDMCKKYMNYHTYFRMKDGSTFDGIIENVDENYVIVWVGEDVIDYNGEHECNEQRQFGSPRRHRRFRRRFFPLTAFEALLLLTFPFRE